MLGGGGHPEALVLQTLDGAHEVRHLGDGNVRNSPGRAFVGGGGHAGGALVGNDDAGSAHALGRTGDGPQVTGVGDVVEHHNERAAVVLLGRLLRRVQNRRHVHVVEWSRLGHDALVATALGNLVELLLRHLLNRHVQVLRLALDVAHQAVALAQVVGHEDALQRHVGAQRLDNRTLAFNEISHGIAFVVVVQW